MSRRRAAPDSETVSYLDVDEDPAPAKAKAKASSKVTAALMAARNQRKAKRLAG